MCKKQTTAVELAVATLRRLRQEVHRLGYTQPKKTTAKSAVEKHHILISAKT